MFHWEDRNGIQQVFLAAAYYGSVVLFKRNWDRHILIAHPPMINYVSEIVATLRQPDGVYESLLHPGERVLFIRHWSNQPAIPGECKESPYLLIPVECRSKEVVSTYFGNDRNHKLGKRLWP